jgi:hypothetical protein
MEETRTILEQFTGLDASLYAVAVVFAVLVRFMRSYWHGFGNRATLAAAGLFGPSGAFLALAGTNHGPRTWQFIVIQAFSLMVAVLIVEFSLRGAASKMPWLPKDDEAADALHGPDEKKP